MTCTEKTQLFGKERALFVPSGTLSNQLALKVHTRPGDEVVIGDGAHIANYESGAGAAISGVQFKVAGSGGLFTATDVAACINPSDYYLPQTSLICLENTHNRSGGRLFSQTDAEAIGRLARERDLPVHLDGARIWNAAVATGSSLKALTRYATTVSVCFSKGLGAPIGSALLGPAQLLEDAHRYRKMLGAGMRQSGIIAAGALFAVRNNRSRLADDHRRAARLAATLAQRTAVTVLPHDTNIVVVQLASGTSASAVAQRCRSAGVLVHAIGPSALRLVTHLDVSDEDIDRACDVLSECLSTA